MLTISVGLYARNLQKALTLIRKELERIRSAPISQSELRRAKEYSIGASRMALERSATQNARLGSSILSYGKIIDPADLHRQLREVTVEEVQQVAIEFLQPFHTTAAIIGPAPQVPMVEQCFA